MDGSGSGSKVEAIKPVILKAGIPLAISVAGFIWVKIISARRKPRGTESLSGMDSDCCDQGRASLEIRDKPGFHDELLGLGRVAESLQEREQMLEAQFLRYCELRDREALLQEIGNTLELELGRAEAMNREVLSIEEEHKRLVGIALEYVKVLQEMQCLKLENESMQKKVNRISRRVKQQSSFIRDSKLRIEAQEKEISSTQLELASDRDAIGKLEEEISELRGVIEQMRQEKDDLQAKLKSVEESVLKTRQEGASLEDFRQLLKEMEHLQKEQAAEEKELVYLRWSNACLRHEMMRNHPNSPDDPENQDMLTAKTDSEGTSHEHYGSDQERACLGIKASHVHCSKRKKLLLKLKKWIDGHGHDHHRVKVGPSDAEEHLHVNSRRSCSSA